MPEDGTFRHITCESLVVKHPVTKDQITVHFANEGGEIVIQDSLGHEKLRLAISPDGSARISIFGTLDKPSVLEFGVADSGGGAIVVRDPDGNIIHRLPTVVAV